MTDKGKFKDANEFIEALDQTRVDSKEIFLQHLGKEFFDEHGDDFLVGHHLYTEMQILSQYDDRELALETFHKMDGGRRNGIIDSLHKTSKGIIDELGRRDKGIFPEPDSYYGDMTVEELKDWLDCLNRFADELRNIGMM